MASKKRAVSKSTSTPKPSSPLLARLSAVWADKRPGFERGLRKGATSAQLAAFEKRLGLRLPKGFATLYAWHDGANDEHEVFESKYGFLPLARILEHKAMLDDVRGEDGTWDRAWVPFLHESYSDLVCIDAGSGEVFAWFNSQPKRVLLAPSVDAWMEAHVAITEAAESLADWDSVYDAFNGDAAKGIRAGISPGYPREA
jgi:cell wall assembly regulator SMI1